VNRWQILELVIWATSAAVMIAAGWAVVRVHRQLTTTQRQLEENQRAINRMMGFSPRPKVDRDVNKPRFEDERKHVGGH
jgi:uncharacterized membrane protein YjfL (UPF0719 family)